MGHNRFGEVEPFPSIRANLGVSATLWRQKFEVSHDHRVPKISLGEILLQFYQHIQGWREGGYRQLWRFLKASLSRFGHIRRGTVSFHGSRTSATLNSPVPQSQTNSALFSQ